MDKLGINILGPVDSMTRLYTVGKGFHGMTGVISMTVEASLYLLFTSDRNYDVTVSGDIMVTREPKENGVTPFNVDWTQASLSNPKRSGTITVINPDAPDEVSTFEVISGAPYVAVKFGDIVELAMRIIVEMDTDLGKLDRSVRAMLEGGKGDDARGKSRLSDRQHELVGAGDARDNGWGDEPFGGFDAASMRRNILL